MHPVKPYIPVLIIRSAMPADVLAGIGSDYLLALALDGTTQGINTNLFKLLINGDRTFVLLLTGNSDLTALPLLDLIRLCLFSKNYLQLRGAPVVAFMEEEQAIEAIAENHKKLLSALELQGWASVTTWGLSDRPFPEQLLHREAPLLLDKLTFDEQYLRDHYFTSLHHMGKHLFFKAESPEEALQLEAEFYALCSSGISGNPLLNAYLSVKTSLDALSRQHSVLQERHKSALLIIEVIRYKYKDDYNELFNWYHNEYEILPLWYKRFGHIIKVITGKRTFLSLFKDNVKKYKT